MQSSYHTLLLGIIGWNDVHTLGLEIWIEDRLTVDFIE